MEEKIIINSELICPRFKEEGWEYFDEEIEEYRLKEDAPQWAKEEFEEFYKKLSSIPDKNGKIIKY